MTTIPIRPRREALPARRLHEQDHRYVPHDRVPDFLLCGWLVVIPARLAAPHDFYSVPMRWCCACRVREPGRAG